MSDLFSRLQTCFAVFTLVTHISAVEQKVIFIVSFVFECLKALTPTFKTLETARETSEGREIIKGIFVVELGICSLAVETHTI